jgi:hypothetical protein
MTRDIAIVICSRGREDYLTRLLDDMHRAFVPALKAAGLSATTFVYAQNYPRAYIEMLAQRFAGDIARGDLIIVEPSGPHYQIGYVVASAIAALHARLGYRLAMLMDDDSLYRGGAEIDANLGRAARDFLDRDARAYSIKLGQGRSLEYWPFIDAKGPVMPFKEKMLWVSRAVMDEAQAFEAFSTLSVGEDAVLAALAWRGGADRCFGVFGIASFLHLAFEPDEETPQGGIAGGYGALVGYVEGKDGDPELGKYAPAYRSGIVPHDVLPEIFVGPDHPHYYINGIRPEAVARYGAPDQPFHRLDHTG